MRMASSLSISRCGSEPRSSMNYSQKQLTTEARRRKTTTEVQGFLDLRPAESPQPITDNNLPTTNDQRLTTGLRTTHDVRRAANSPILDEQQPRPAVIRAPVF